jgi:hypothetical protein
MAKHYQEPTPQVISTNENKSELTDADKQHNKTVNRANNLINRVNMRLPNEITQGTNLGLMARDEAKAEAKKKPDPEHYTIGSTVGIGPDGNYDVATYRQSIFTPEQIQAQDDYAKLQKAAKKYSDKKNAKNKKDLTAYQNAAFHYANRPSKEEQANMDANQQAYAQARADATNPELSEDAWRQQTNERIQQEVAKEYDGLKYDTVSHKWLPWNNETGFGDLGTVDNPLESPTQRKKNEVGKQVMQGLTNPELATDADKPVTGTKATDTQTQAHMKTVLPTQADIDKRVNRAIAKLDKSDPAYQQKVEDIKNKYNDKYISKESEMFNDHGLGKIQELANRLNEFRGNVAESKDTQHANQLDSAYTRRALASQAARNIENNPYAPSWPGFSGWIGVRTKQVPKINNIFKTISEVPPDPKQARQAAINEKIRETKRKSLEAWQTEKGYKPAEGAEGPVLKEATGVKDKHKEALWNTKAGGRNLQRAVHQAGILTVLDEFLNNGGSFEDLPTAKVAGHKGARERMQELYNSITSDPGYERAVRSKQAEIMKAMDTLSKDNKHYRPGPEDDIIFEEFQSGVTEAIDKLGLAEAQAQRDEARSAKTALNAMQNANMENVEKNATGRTEKIQSLGDGRYIAIGSGDNVGHAQYIINFAQDENGHNLLEAYPAMKDEATGRYTTESNQDPITIDLDSVGDKANITDTKALINMILSTGQLKSNRYSRQNAKVEEGFKQLERKQFMDPKFTNKYLTYSEAAKKFPDLSADALDKDIFKAGLAIDKYNDELIPLEQVPLDKLQLVDRPLTKEEKHSAGVDTRELQGHAALNQYNVAKQKAEDGTDPAVFEDEEHPGRILDFSLIPKKERADAMMTGEHPKLRWWEPTKRKVKDKDGNEVEKDFVIFHQGADSPNKLLSFMQGGAIVEHSAKGKQYVYTAAYNRDDPSLENYVRELKRQYEEMMGTAKEKKPSATDDMKYTMRKR